MVLAASLGLAGCALIDELKDTVSKMVSQDGHEGGVPDTTGGILPTKTPRQDAKASTEKDPRARKLQEPHTVKLQNKPPTPVPTEPARPARAGRAIRAVSVCAIAIACSLAGSSVTRKFFTLRSQPKRSLKAAASMPRPGGNIVCGR